MPGILELLCWGLTSQSTIFQSCRDGAIASWVSNQYFRGVKCLAQGHNTAAVGLEPRTSRSGVRHSTTEPPRSPKFLNCVLVRKIFKVSVHHLKPTVFIISSQWWSFKVSGDHFLSLLLSEKKTLRKLEKRLESVLASDTLLQLHHIRVIQMIHGCQATAAESHDMSHGQNGCRKVLRFCVQGLVKAVKDKDKRNQLVVKKILEVIKGYSEVHTCINCHYCIETCATRY